MGAVDIDVLTDENQAYRGARAAEGASFDPARAVLADDGDPASDEVILGDAGPVPPQVWLDDEPILPADEPWSPDEPEILRDDDPPWRDEAPCEEPSFEVADAVAIPEPVADEDTDPIDLIDPSTRYLRLRDRHGREQWFPLGDVSVVVGRSDMADLVVRGRGVALFHVRIAPVAQGYRVVDLDARSGTALNGDPVEEALLEPGDRLVLGDHELLFCQGLPQALRSPAGRSPAAPIEVSVSDATALGSAMPGALSLREGRQLEPTELRGLERRSSRTLRRRDAERLARRQARALQRRAPTSVRHRDPDDLVWKGPAEPDMADRIAGWVAHLRRHSRMLMVMTAMGLLAGLASHRLFPPAATAHFELSLVQEASDNPVDPAVRRTLTFFRSARDNFLGAELVGRTLEQLGEPSVDAGTIERVQDSLEFERASQFTYRGSYEAVDDEQATRFLKQHLDLFLETEVKKAIRVLTAEVDTLEEQLTKTERELTSVEASLAAFKVDSGEASPEHLPALQRQLLDLQADRRREAQLVSRAGADVEIARKRLASEGRVVQLRVEDAKPYSAEIAQTQQDLIAARAAGKGIEHPHIKSLEQRLSGLQAHHDRVLAHGDGRVKTRANPAYLRAKLELEEAKSLQHVAHGDVSRTEREEKRLTQLLRELPIREAELASLTRRHVGLETQHGELLVRLGHSRLQLALERRQVQARFDLITPPTIEPASATGLVVARGGIGVTVGLMLALWLAWMSDLRVRVRRRLAAQV